jgi:hypothetical protein
MAELSSEFASQASVEIHFGVQCVVFTYVLPCFIQYEGLESSLKEASFEKESTEAQSLEVKNKIWFKS